MPEVGGKSDKPWILYSLDKRLKWKGASLYATEDEAKIARAETRKWHELLAVVREKHGHGSRNTPFMEQARAKWDKWKKNQRKKRLTANLS